MVSSTSVHHHIILRAMARLNVLWTPSRGPFRSWEGREPHQMWYRSFCGLTGQNYACLHQVRRHRQRTAFDDSWLRKVIFSCTVIYNGKRWKVKRNRRVRFIAGNSLKGTQCTWCYMNIQEVNGPQDWSSGDWEQCSTMSDRATRLSDDMPSSWDLDQWMMPSMSCWRPSTCLFCPSANHTRNWEVATQLLRILSQETRKMFLQDQNRLHDRRGNADRQEDWSWTRQGRSTTFVRRGDVMVRANQSGARQKTMECWL